MVKTRSMAMAVDNDRSVMKEGKYIGLGGA